MFSFLHPHHLDPYHEPIRGYLPITQPLKLPVVAWLDSFGYTEHDNKRANADENPVARDVPAAITFGNRQFSLYFAWLFACLDMEIIEIKSEKLIMIKMSKGGPSKGP